MPDFTNLPPEEVERRRKASVVALQSIDRAKFEAWYQEECDRFYWENGRCCAGCDHWGSDAALIGTCAAAGIVSGQQVLASMGLQSCSYTPPPGLPYTNHNFHCGKFRDDFDWLTLPVEYLERISATIDKKLKDKPEMICHA